MEICNFILMNYDIISMKQLTFIKFIFFIS